MLLTVSIGFYEQQQFHHKILLEIIKINLPFPSYVKSANSIGVAIYPNEIMQLQSFIYLSSMKPHSLRTIGCLLLLLAIFAHAQLNTPTLLLPIETTKGVRTQYSIGFITDTAVPHSAKIRITFPFEFDPRHLITHQGCQLKKANSSIIDIPCTLTNRSFTIEAGQINMENIIVVISNILNPSNVQISSNFIVDTMFKDVVVVSNSSFGRTSFTSPPIDSGAIMTVNNYQNVLIEQGSTWVFNFLMSQSYPANHTIRFIFPEGFSSSKVTCNITGVIVPSLKSRVLPNSHVYDCLNINSQLSPQQQVILSGVVNPNYQMSISDIMVHIIQPNNRVVVEKFEMSNTVDIKRKDMNATVTIPNLFRNNSITYTFEINMDSDLYAGDYLKIDFDGKWTFFTEQSTILEGINSNSSFSAVFETEYDWPNSQSILYIKNFSSILRSSQIAFYLSLKTPLEHGDYDLDISAHRSNGGVVQSYSRTIEINRTTGYIREMRLHPMVQTYKLPVGETGPLQITLGLMNNLPQTNVLTFGKFQIKITPNIPLPDVNVNGVPKCYFYGDIQAKNCTYDDSDPDFTFITVFTPVDFNFQSSQIPFMVTTEGYSSPEFQGITIDNLVQRYHFHVQFYTDYSQDDPTQVIFTEWIPDSLKLNSLVCQATVLGEEIWDHLKCSFTSPSVDLNQPGKIHIFRVQLVNWDISAGYAANHIYPDFPCVGYGANLLADPYIKCDLITWITGPYASTTANPYINIYGFEQLPANSAVTFELPKIKRSGSTDNTKINFYIMEDTFGYQSEYLEVYSQTINIDTTVNWAAANMDYDSQGVSYTLSNPLLNRVSDLTLDDFDLVVAGVTHIILEVDQQYFQDIGRGDNIVCGEHVCSKFNKPVQYFILYPSRSLTQTEDLVFPSIVTPAMGGDFQFKIRVYKDKNYVKHSKFTVTIDRELLAAPTYELHPTLQSVTDIYPNTVHYYRIQWTTINPLPDATSAIKITLDNIFTLASDYYVLDTLAPSHDSRGIQCELWVGQNIIILTNLGDVPANTDFTLDLQLTTATSAPTVSPTLSIVVYYHQQDGYMTDYIDNSPFSPATLTNTNLDTFTSFTVADPQTIERAPQKGYFGPLLINFKPGRTTSNTNGYYLIIETTNDFYPYSDQLDLPLSCKINNIRLLCTYSLDPFTVTIHGITNKLNTNANNVINITTEHLDHNGIHYPATQGTYLMKATVKHSNGVTTYEIGQHFFQIIPKQVAYFNATYAHRDIGRDNIFTFNFRTADQVIPSYTDTTTAGRIYIAFPTKDQSNINVFDRDLGYADGDGTVVPCWFKTGPSYIAPVSGSQLSCSLRTSPQTPKYAYVEIKNFDQLPVGTDVQVIMAKIKNPSQKAIDVDFVLKVNTIDISTKEETALYQSTYNMFFNMLTASISFFNEADSTTIMFQPGAKVGDEDKYFNAIPVTQAASYKSGDWYIIDMDPDFPLEGTVAGCQSPYYLNCIVFKEINWLAVHIGNTTLLNLFPRVTKLPTSISRSDTTYQAYNFMSERWAETITYTITADERWMQLRGTISNFDFEVLGSHDKLNIGQREVQVMVTFTVQHIVDRGGTIQVKFPNNPTKVPNLRPHCRSAVTLDSELKGDPTQKPAINMQGDVGCLVQNDYSWVITSFDTLPAGSVVKVVGVVDLPLEQTVSLGTGYIVTYGNTHASDIFGTGRYIDYLSTNFELQVNNQTWNVDIEPTLYSSEPLRINHKGQLKFKLNLATALSKQSSGGYIDLSLWKKSTMGNAGGFNGPTSKMVCTIVRINPANKEMFGCKVTQQTGSEPNYYLYRLQTAENLPANTDLQITLTTQNGDANEGINFPTATGVYKIETQIKYSSVNSQQVSKVHFIEVYGPNFNTLNFISTISLPDEKNFIIVEMTPSNNIQTNEQLIIEIPTVTLDGQQLFEEDLGMGYEDYDDLEFDLFECTGLSSMECKVYTGDNENNQPVKIVCSNFDAQLTTSSVLKMGFWVKNPSTDKGLAIPIQVYSYDTNNAKKDCWSILQAGIKIIPTSNSPISSSGGFDTGSDQRQISGQSFNLIARNTKNLLLNDLYILKFNFDLRNEFLQSGKFKYNIGLGGTGDVIFMRNSKTVLLRVGSTPLNFEVSSSTTINSQINTVFYNPPTQLTIAEQQISAYAAYLSSGECEKIIYTDPFPIDLVPREMTGATFTLTPINSNQYFGQRQDYRFTFVYSTTSTAKDMSLVKKISIQFPAFQTYDMKFAGTQCIGHISSAIEVADCVIDVDTYTMWITPVQKSTYINSNSLIVETKGLAIINPQTSTTIDVNDFVFRFYTWDEEPAPTLMAESEDYVFMTQDDTNIGSATLTYTSAFIEKHSFLQIPEQIYVNEFQPGSSFLGTTKMKTPFEFKFKCMANFPDRAGTSNFHEINLKYSTYYSYTAQLTVNDLYKNVPTCQLNGQYIQKCSINATHIIMLFQQPLTNGQQVAVRFSVLNPTNQADDGFFLNNLNFPTITLPLQFVVHGGSKYQAEAEPFHSYFREGSQYPELGIHAASVITGTTVVGKLNYLQFSVSFSRTDINGLVLQIPVLSHDGTVIYTDPTLLGLDSGQAYPCSVGINTDVFCYYQKGSANGFGRPTRIYITEFATPIASPLSLRILFTNPDKIGVYPTFHFKAFGGTISGANLMGSQLMGRFQITQKESFKTIPETGSYTTSTCTAKPNKGLWQTQTDYDFYIGSAMAANSYSILQWRLEHSTYGQISEYQYDSSFIIDYFTIAYAHDDRRLYMVKKLTSSYGGGASDYHTFGHLRQKHFLFNSQTVYLLKNPNFEVVSCTVDLTWLSSNRMVDRYGAMTMVFFDIKNRQRAANTYQYVAVNLGSVTSLELSDDDPADMIVAVKFTQGKPFTSFSSTTGCNLQSGLTSTDKLKPVICECDNSNSQVLFKNVNKFSENILRFYYSATNIDGQQGGTKVQVRVYANSDSYRTSDGWALLRGTTTNSITLDKMKVQSSSYSSTSAPNYNNWQQYNMMPSGWVANGYVRIISVTGTQIQIQMKRDSTQTFSDAYYMLYRFYVPKLTFSGIGSSSFSPNSYGRSPSTSASGSTFYLEYSYMSDSNPDWQTWSAGSTMTFTVNFASITGEGLNSPETNQIYITAAITWRISTYHSSNTPKCGCNGCYRSSCCGDWDDGSCRSYYDCNWDSCCTPLSCRWYYSWDTFVLTDTSTSYAPYSSLASSASVDLVSIQRSVETQLKVSISSLNTNLGTDGSFLLIHLDDQAYPSNNPFPATRTADLGAEIDCMCSINGGGYSTPTCVRYLNSGMDPAIGVYISASSSQSIDCYFPGYLTSSSNSNLVIHLHKKKENYFHTYVPNDYWSKYRLENIQQTYTTLGTSGTFNAIYPTGFWTTNRKSYQAVNFDVDIVSSSSLTNPTVYMSMYGPKPLPSYCSSGFSQCRVYNSFINRRYYVVAVRSATTSTVTFTQSTNMPPSDDISSSFYNVYVAMADTSSERYYGIKSTTQGQSYLSPEQPTYAYSTALYGSNLQGLPSGFIVSIDLNGNSIYSVQTNYGAYQGSHMKLTLTGFSTLYGCGAVLSYRPFSFSSPFYCEVTSGTVIKIYARQDIQMTGTLHITFYTDSVPSSVTYRFQLYDKYISGSDYAISVDKSAVFTRPTSSALVQSTSVLWRRQTYKELRLTNGPKRIIFNNNFQYVYDTNTNSNSDALVVNYPGGINSAHKYFCLVKEYLPGKRHLYTQFQVPCAYYAADKVRVTAQPDHILSPDYYYELTIYRNNNGASCFIDDNTADNYYVIVETHDALTSPNVVNRDYVLIQEYQTVYPITLNSIYTLTWQASATNSLYMDLSVTSTTSTFQYLEFEFPNLGLSSFQIENGGRIPCYLQASMFNKPGSYQNEPFCRGYTEGLDNDSPLIIRVLGMQAFPTASNTFKLAFDNFNNPPQQTYQLIPMDVRVTLVDSTNAKVFTSNFPAVYFSKSFNLNVPSVLGGTLTQSNADRGASQYQYFSISWPYTSSISDASQKMVMKIQGGITCCNDYANFELDDNQVSSYTQLWTDTYANMTVYKTPTHNINLNTQIQIKNVINPYPIDMETYEQLKEIQILMYKNYENVYIKQIAQFAYSAYTQLSQINVAGNLGSPVDSTRSYSYHQGYPMTYDITYTSTISSFSGRDLDYTLLKFTSGVASIEQAYAKYSSSPFIINPLLSVKIFKNSDDDWCLKIKGLDDSLFSSSESWIIRMRFYPNGNTLSYSSETYAINGELQFQNTGTENLNADGYSTSPILPSSFDLYEQRYFKNYYQLQRQRLYADTGLTNHKLSFRFTVPSEYTITQIQNFVIQLPTLTDFIPTHAATKDIICIIQPTESVKTQLGIGLYSQCEFDLAIAKYEINAPIGGLVSGVQYTLTIIQSDQFDSSFDYPETPVYQEISFVYNSQAALKFGDTYRIHFSGLMKQFQVTHLSLMASKYNMIGFEFKPRFTLAASSLTSPVTESVLQIELESKYFLTCLGVDSIYSVDAMTFQSGVYFSHFSNPSVTDANTRLLCGQYSESYSPVKLRVTDYGQFTADTTYYFRFPLITNPAGTNTPFIYKIRLLSYASSKFYPVVMGEYSYHNLEQTVSGSTSSQSTSISAGNAIQSTISISLSYSTYNAPDNTNILVKFRNNALAALTSLSALTSLTNTNYDDYEYYPNINLCVFIKSNSVDDRTISLGSFPTSLQKESFTISWMYAYPSNSIIYTSNFGSSNQHTTQSLAQATTWNTKVLSKVSGLANTNSMGVYQLQWKSNSLSFAQGSYMKISIHSYLKIIDEYCKTMSGFVTGTLPTSNLICRRNSDTEVYIGGYGLISPGTTLTITLRLQIAYTSINNLSPNANIIVYSSDDKKIIDGAINAMTLNLGQYGCSNLGIMSYMLQPLLKETSQQLDFSFRLDSHTLTSTHYLLVDFGNWTIDSGATQGQLIWKYKVANNIYWVPTEVQNTHDNVYKIKIYDNYTMPSGQDIHIKFSTVLPDAYNGINFPQQQWSYLTIQAYDGSDTLLEHQYLRKWIDPYHHTSLVVTPVLDYIEAVSLYQIQITPNVSVADGDVISLEFTTSDQLKTSTLFDNYLGIDSSLIQENSTYAISCHESDGNTYISDDPITCQFFPGDNTASPPIPAVIQIPVLKDVPASTTIKFNILGIKNPQEHDYPIAITAKLMDHCESEDFNNLCAFYKSTHYIEFDDSPATIPSQANDIGSVAFDPDIISAVNADHTFTAPYLVNAGDYVRIKYYDEVPIPQICSIEASDNAICYSYPRQNVILIKALANQANPYSYTLNGMTNMYQTKGSEKPYTQIWDSSTRRIRARFNTDYSVSHITVDPVSSNSLSMTFTPTLTDNYQMKYGFLNIAKIQITHAMQNEHIEMISINAPSQVTLNADYCNATLESTTAEATPYPFRFQCHFINTHQLKLIKQDNFPTWDSTFLNKNIIVYLRYFIGDYNGTTDNWEFNTYTADTSDTNYRVSQGFGNFEISEEQSPFIYKINFPTEAFNKRTCRTGELCMFYGYLLPSTSISDIPISYMTYTLPPEFGYSDIVSYGESGQSKCTMQDKNSNPTDIIVPCSAVRKDSDVIIKFAPSSYNHNYQLISIGHHDESKLFLAPDYPGNHYQVKVNLFSSSDVLVESMMVNLTTVYGSALVQQDIQIQIPMDADAVGMFQFKFTLGEYDILPGYPNSPSNRITSMIQIEFSKSFEYDLGTGKLAAQSLACLPISGIQLSVTDRLTCKIYPSVSSITYPIITVTGYDRIIAGSDVVIQIAGLKTLPDSVEDYIKIGVSLTYYDYGGVKGYLYEPTGVVVGGTSAPSSPKAISPLTVTQSSTNFVGDLVDYSFSGTIQAGFTPVTPSDYVIVEFQENGFEGYFSINDQAVCNSALGSKCYSFGLSHIIYFHPSSAISSSSLSFNLNNIINSAYALQYVNTSFTVKTLVNGKINAVGTTYLTKFSKPSKNISGLVTKVDSLYGGDSGINYQIEFKLNSDLPEEGIVHLTVPSIYKSLFDLNSNCILGAGFPSASYCTIVNSHQLTINPNGNVLDKDFSYSFTLTNITNPNVNLTNYVFTIRSQFNNNIYQPKIISSNTFQCPSISLTTVKSCTTFDVQLTANNALYEGTYSITMICPSYIKEASQLAIKLSWSPDPKPTICSSPSSSLYSYDCAIKTSFTNSVKNTYVSMYLKEISPQKLISLTSIIRNGPQGTYKLTADVSYKGFTYLSTTSNSFFVSSNAINEVTYGRDIKFHNYPYNRNYDAIYTLTMPNPNLNADTMIVTLPASIQSIQDTISCIKIETDFDQNYFNLISQQDTNEMSCSAANGEIKIEGIDTAMDLLGDDDFLRIGFYRLKNANTSNTGESMRITFLDTSTSVGSVVQKGTVQIPSRVSDPPVNLQINTITPSNHKFLKRATYTIGVSTASTTSIQINANSQIGLMIIFPTEYRQIWERIQQPPELVLTLGSDEFTTVPTMTNGTLTSIFSINTALSFNDINIEFQFRNPSSPIDCSIVPVFSISLFDFRMNNIIAETLSNNIECPVFNGRLYEISIAGNLQLEKNSVNQYAISIQKAASFLNITPITTNTAIQFSPKSIIFSNYSSTLEKLKVTVLQPVSGDYEISFMKVEEGSQIFYNDIQEQTITIVDSSTTYTISFGTVNAKSVGLPIDLPVHLSQENPRQFTLLYTHNCTNGYFFNPPSYINVPSGVKQTSIAITYQGNKIPIMCQIVFRISSLTNVNYHLPINIIYMSGSLSIDRSSTLAPMILYMGTTPIRSQGVGQTILSEPSENLKPVLYKVQQRSVSANGANFLVSMSEKGSIYFAVLELGANKESVTQAQIYNRNVSQGITYGNSTSSAINTISTIQSELSVTDLSAQTSYLIAVYLNSTLGNSDIHFQKFSTQKSSNGAGIVLAFSSIIDRDQIKSALSKVLRISEERINFLSVHEQLVSYQSQFDASVMNSRQYLYDIAIGPSIKEDYIKPIDSLAEFIDSSRQLQEMKEMIPDFIIEYEMSAREIILSKPRFRDNQIEVVSVSHDQATVKIHFWEQVFAYGVIVPKFNGTLLSSQIIQGYDQNNVPLSPQFTFSGLTDEKGNIQMTFTLLNQSTQYTAYISGESLLPYNPRLRLGDNEIKWKNIRTSKNFNLQGSENSIVQELQKQDKKLASAVKNHISSMKNKKKVTASFMNTEMVNGHRRKTK